MKYILYTTSILVFLAIGASSLQCYICNSVTDGDKKCGHGEDDVDKSFLKECTTIEQKFKDQLSPLPTNKNYTVCRKMVTIVDFDVNENKAGERIKRTCGWDTEEEKYNTDCYYRGGLGGRMTVCSCPTEKCNGSTTFGLSIPLVILAIFSGLKVLWN